MEFQMNISGLMILEDNSSLVRMTNILKTDISDIGFFIPNE
ncbi:MAG: hypothetical protein ACI9AV_001655 [Sediminicola sp.]|jgi:hypothetical protein